MRLYRALLRLLPASFRSEYADEMATLFARRRRDAQGRLGLGRLWVEGALDVVGSAARVHLDLLRQDLRHLGRSLRRAPGFALTVVLVSALGIGATTAAFSVTDHVLIRPLPFPEPDRLVELWQSDRAEGYRNELSPANYRDWKRLTASFEAMGAFYKNSVNLVGDGDPVRLQSAVVTHEVLPLVGTRPILGRTFAADEEREGAPGTVLLSQGLWRERFGSDPGVLGRTLRLDDEPYRVIGVMPEGFHFPQRGTELWLPLRFEKDAFERRDDLYLYCVARLRRGTTLEAARGELALVAAQLEREYPVENKNVGASAIGLRDELSQQRACCCSRCSAPRSACC